MNASTTATASSKLKNIITLAPRLAALRAELAGAELPESESRLIAAQIVDAADTFEQEAAHAAAALRHEDPLAVFEGLQSGLIELPLDLELIARADSEKGDFARAALATERECGLPAADMFSGLVDGVIELPDAAR